MLKLLIVENGNISETVNYKGDEQPDILFHNKKFYVRYSDVMYRPATAFIFEKSTHYDVMGTVTTIS